ncbi:hypothetical protein BGZ52_004670 [Haplosporangium bisporale]|nr:hypothetical protein BGZ52_004670 [Haplosporangium bisporale]
MAARFFRSIPQSVTIRDPYEEVFMLFTTETSEAPWAHNRSVSQTSTRLEVELDFTPAPSPAVSQPGSRPESRTGAFSPVVSSMNPQSPSPTPSSLGPGAGALVPSSGPSGGYTGTMVVGARSQLALESPTPIAGLIGPGPESDEPMSRPGSGSDPNAGAIELYNGDQATSNSPVPTLPRNRVLAARAMMGNRKSSRKLLTDATTASSASQQPVKKPVVIHQSLSTLSQPGQTGTVVWDSSILMAKFLLSIKNLHTRYYLTMEGGKKDKIRGRHSGRKMSLQEQQIRQLEAQAKHLKVSADGELLETESDDDNDGQEGDDSATDSSEDEMGDDDEQEDSDHPDPLVFDPAHTTILELGSGCGLLGIVLAEFCKELLLTDQAPVLPLLVKNLRKNLDKKYFEDAQKPTSSPSSSSKKGTPSANGSQDSVKPCHIQVQELIWGQELDQDLKRGQGVDYVIATDVVYNESVVPKLVQTLKNLCEIRQHICKQAMSTGGKGSFGRNHVPQRTVVLLGQELRTDYVHLAFLEGLEQAGFRMVRIPKRMMDADYQSGYVVYAFYLIN